jgi:hypothetical protein
MVRMQRAVVPLLAVFTLTVKVKVQQLPVLDRTLKVLQHARAELVAIQLVIQL